MTGLKRVVVLATGLALAGAGLSLAAQAQPDRLSAQQMQALVTSIDTRAAAFSATLSRDTRAAKDGFVQSVAAFGQSARQLRNRVDRQQATSLDADDVLHRGASIDRHVQQNQLGTRTEQAWRLVCGDLDALARAYSVESNWREPGYAIPTSAAAVRHRLTGTYRLDAAGGDDPRRAAELAVRSVSSDQRQQTYQSLLARLEPPAVMVIERDDRRVSMASTRGQRVTVEADGRDHVERWDADQTMHTRATLAGERLDVVTTGNRASAFTVTFEPTDNGAGMSMSRTIDDERLRQPVTVRSAYRRVSADAQWDTDTGAWPDPYADTEPRTGSFVAEGTRFVALLDNALSTADAREGDRFTMTTRSPSPYEGAIVEGFVSTVNESGRMTGRADMTLNFRSIRLRNGDSLPFDGVIEEVKTPDGTSVRVGQEGSVASDDSQTQKTVERSVVGAALGAIIGAVAGGGKGAAIGAVIGAGGGAGTVMIEGRDHLDLQRGTEVTITAGDPRRQRTAPGAQR